VLEEVAADAVAEEGDGLGPVLRGDPLQPRGDVVERLAPGHRGPLLPPALALPDQGGAQAVGVVVGADAAGASRAEPAAREGIVGIALDLPEAAVLLGRDRSALPEAEVAVGRHAFDPVPGARRAEQAGGERRAGDEGGRPRPGADLQKSPA